MCPHPHIPLQVQTKEGSRREQAPRNTCSLLTATIKPDAEVRAAGHCCVI